MFTSKRFLPFFITQLLGALNDNIFKNALVILIAYKAAANTHLMVNLAAGLFILPFLLFSGLAGQFADKLDKSQLIRWIKMAEIVLMLLVIVGLFMDSLTVLLTVLFLTGSQSAFFGPVKYGLLPQHLHKDELVSGNAMVETGTFLAILMGTITGGIFANFGEAGKSGLSFTLICIAVAGWLSSLMIPKAPAVDRDYPIDYNPWRTTFSLVRLASRNRFVLHSIIAISWFWAFGALFLTQFPEYTRTSLAGDPSVATVLLTAFSVGIGLGSWLSQLLSKGNIEPGLVPLGAIGMTLFTIDLGLMSPISSTGDLVNAWEFISNPGNWRLLFDLIMIATSGGIFIVQLYALVQDRSEAHIRSRVIAANNILNAMFMVAAALLAAVLLHNGLTTPQLFLVAAIMNVVVTSIIVIGADEFYKRMIKLHFIKPVLRLFTR